VKKIKPINTKTATDKAESEILKNSKIICGKAEME